MRHSSAGVGGMLAAACCGAGLQDPHRAHAADTRRLLLTRLCTRCMLCPLPSWLPAPALLPRGTKGATALWLPCRSRQLSVALGRARGGAVKGLQICTGRVSGFNMLGLVLSRCCWRLLPAEKVMSPPSKRGCPGGDCGIRQPSASHPCAPQ
jgi:hypothetical protein